MVESFHIPRALSDEALRLLTTLPMDEIERRLRVPVADSVPVARLPENVQVIEPANHTILAPIPAPIPVSERLPEKAEMTDDDEVWVEYPGGEYPLGDTGDYDWEPHKWILSPIAKFTIRENRRWLPAHALSLPEVNDD